MRDLLPFCLVLTGVLIILLIATGHDIGATFHAIGLLPIWYERGRDGHL
jgi:hypothetical protein